MHKKRVLLMLLFVFGSFSLLILNAQEELPKSGRYRIVPSQSKISIHVGTAGVLGFMGHGHTMVPTTFSGDMELNPKNTVPATLALRIDATSLHETAQFKPEEKATIEKQLHGEVLETAKYPEITFKSTGFQYSMHPGHVFDTQIQGDLTLHGVTKKITVPARVLDTGPNLRATGEVKINRKDYNIEPKDAAGGTVKVDKTLEVSFDLVFLPE
jgi:polyisoprenoid-binding protein YceI